MKKKLKFDNEPASPEFLRTLCLSSLSVLATRSKWALSLASDLLCACVHFFNILDERYKSII